MRIAKTNTIMKRSVNKLITVDNTYHDTKQISQNSNQTGKTRE